MPSILQFNVNSDKTLHGDMEPKLPPTWARPALDFDLHLFTAEVSWSLHDSGEQYWPAGAGKEWVSPMRTWPERVRCVRLVGI